MDRGFWEKLPRPFFVLAPMADVTDTAFRQIIAKYGKFTRPDGTRGGPDVMYTEFVSADGLFKGGYEKLIHDLKFTDAERPIVAQFFSRDPDLMARAAALAEELGFDGVDINMGCPDKAVCRQGSGAAMIKDPKLAREIIRAAKAATKLPVSVKTRTGYNEDELDTWLPNLLAEEPAAVTIHARTKKEMSKVPAHWESVGRAVAIRDRLRSETLIVGNGDVNDLADARAKARETGCDGVMLGRAIFGNPWAFSGKPRPLLPERLRVLREHILLFDELLGGVKSFAVMKKHFKAYLKGPEHTKKLLARLMETKIAPEARACLDKALAER